MKYDVVRGHKIGEIAYCITAATICRLIDLLKIFVENFKLQSQLLKLWYRQGRLQDIKMSAVVQSFQKCQRQIVELEFIMLWTVFIGAEEGIESQK